MSEAERTGRGAEVAEVVQAYQRHHPRARPNTTEQGLVAERMLQDGFTVAELVEAVDGCHAPGSWHVENGRTGLELIMRDSAKVESFRRTLEARASVPPPPPKTSDFVWEDQAADAPPAPAHLQVIGE